MREIKFRAWGNCGSIHSEDSEVYTMWQMDKDWNFTNDYYIFDKQSMPKDSIYMQYTGLKDKNGVEIYEGDIINTPRDIFKIEYGEKDYSCIFYLDSLGCFMSLPYLVGLKDFEVIGNIHENPELLK